MQLLTPLAALFGIEVEAMTERLRNTIIIHAVMMVLGLVGACFLLAAGFFLLAELYGPIYASLILGGVFLILALAVYLGSRLGEARRRKEAASKRRSTETSAFVTTAALTALPALLKSPIGRVVGLPAIALAGYLLLRGGAGPRDD